MLCTIQLIPLHRKKLPEKRNNNTPPLITFTPFHCTDSFPAIEAEREEMIDYRPDRFKTR
jgi:hypothetical protein